MERALHLPHDGLGAVGAPVVDDDDVEVLELEIAEGAQGLADPRLLVVREHHEPGLHVVARA